MKVSLKEKVFGAVFGYAIGDALGLGTEFMTRKEVKVKYPDGLTEYRQIIRDAHRSQFKRGEYTNDTILIKILLKSMIECERFDYMDYASRLREWYLSGPVDLLANMRWVLSQEDYEEHPKTVAKRIWEEMDVDENPSDALGKALFIGMWNEDLEKNSHDVCTITHPQLRCQTASEIIAKMANALTWKNEEVPYEVLHEIAERKDPDMVRYLEIARYGEISDFRLDNEASFWYVRKAMGAALWALWHCDSTDDALLTVVNQGGDADTNASLAMALVALKYGYSSIGKNYIDNLCEREKIRDLAEKFTDLLTRKFTK